MALDVGTVVEITRDPPYKEYDVHKGDIGKITYVASTGKYSIHINGKQNPHYDSDRKYGENGDFWIPCGCVREYQYKQGDRVVITSNKSKYKGYEATVYREKVGYGYCSKYLSLFVDGTKYQPGYPHNKYLELVKTSVELIKGYNKDNKKEKNMSKLTGFTKVAKVVIGNRDWYHAIYPTDYIEKGDKVIVSGSTSAKWFTVDEVYSVEEAKELYSGEITSEVICKVDTDAYDQRCSNRLEAEKLCKEMDKRISEIEEVNKYVLYAREDVKMANLLDQYKKLV